MPYCTCMRNILILVENEKSRVINTLLRHTYDVLLKQDWFQPPLHKSRAQSNGFI